MGKLIDGKLIAKKIEQKTAKQVALLKKQGHTPKLAVVLVGADLPSQTYVRKKGQAAESVGMDFKLYELPEKITEIDLIKKIKTIQTDKKLSGIIVQLPLPEHLYTTNILNAIKPELDVDCLTDTNLGKLVMKTNYIVPPTPGAVMSIIHDLKFDLVGKNVTIIGMGALVGKPLAIMMANERASVMTCNSKTKDIKKKCLMSDLIVTGVGVKNILCGNMVKKNAIVIDTGVSFLKGKMSGDVNVEEVIKKASYVTPTPGGVGPITVARLLWNTVICTEQKIRNIKKYKFND
ncbi:MAG: bifunctional 5,10-methylenetetrahydrofolate dehydrogenase/5,10-methenyltetrahydrofolate cyclohydrolase [Candidatus Magasanikiibacteriota bacterium]